MGQPERLGRYEIHSTLGRGSMGIVYLAHDPVIDRMVALKTLREDHDERFGVEMRQRFLREARAAGRLSHPNIVTVFDAAEDQEQQTAFIAMEYLAGTTLKDTLSSGHRFDAQRAAEIGAVMADALAYAHSEGVVHRDVKPANIIMTKEGDVWITDFGIARLEASELTVEGAVIGSPFYMSPEQIRGEPVDGRSDLYSLGVILFEVLTGQRPFTGGSLPELSITIVKQAAVDPAALTPGLPAALSEIVLRCLAKDPDSRFQTGTDLAAALREADLEAPSAAEGAVAGTVFELALPEGETVFEIPVENAVTHVTRRGDLEDAPAGGRARRWPKTWIAAAAVAAVLSAVIAIAVITRTPDPGPSPKAAVGLPASAESATLEILYDNRLRVAQIAVRMDDIPIWSSQLQPPEDLAETMTGRETTRALTIPEGVHRISVHIVGRLSKVEAQGAIEGEFHAGQPRKLEVSLDPETHELGLAWVR